MTPTGPLRFLFLSSLLLLPTSQNGDREIRKSLLSRDYGRAVTLLTQELDKQRNSDEPKHLDRLLFLLANTELVAGKRAEAERDFRAVLQKHPGSRWQSLAEFGLARTLAAEHRFQDAAQIQQKAIARLLSEERRVELSETYVGLATEALQKDPPDRKGAIAFLDLAIGLELPEAKEREHALRAADLAFEAEDWGEAAKRYEALVLRDRPTVFAGPHGRPARDLRLRLAMSWRRANRVGEARRLLEDLQREITAAEDAGGDLCGVRLELARCFGVPTGGPEMSRGIDVLRSFLDRNPEDGRAIEAASLLAAAQAQLGRLEQALNTNDLLMERWGSSEGKEIAEAWANKGLWLGRLKRFDEAARAWQAYLTRFPAHSRWVEGQTALIDLELEAAHEQFRKGKEGYEEAERLYRRFLEAHPLDPRAGRIALTLANMKVEVEEFPEARRLFEDCASRYAGRPEASEAAFRVGELLETRLRDLPAAVEAYAKVQGPWQGQARQRLAVLREKRLVLRTERVFQTDEKPTIKVVSRNLPKLRVRVFKLALDDFFEGTLGRTSIESLAIEAISPDESFESAVDPYVPYAETERDVALPFTDAGAYVVKVDDGELESSTLVLVSDLAVVTKTSRKELFVFAQDTRQVRPQPGARIVVTDGTKVLCEGVTDERGAFRYTGKEVEGAARLHVLASTARGSAATTMDLGDLFVSQGLVARTFVYTDRGLFRPGEVVHAKAVLREVDGGRYVLPADKDYDCDFVDANGRLLARKAVGLSAFGTLEAAFAVPSQGGHGSYTVRILRRRDRAALGQAQVQVGDFSTPRVSLELESDHEVLLRGDKLRGRIEARFFFGGPVRDRRVQVVTHIDGVRRVLDGRTDAAGGFDWEFDTSEALGEQILTVQAAIPSEQAFVQKGYHLRTTAFDLSLELPSEVYLVGEDLEARATAVGHDGKKLALPLGFELFRMEATSQGPREIPVGKAEVRSEAEDGRATARFALAKGGTHRLRVAARDRFGNTIETSRTFFVSGKDDEVKLRLLSRVQYAKVGDELAVRVVNRAGPRLCLVTYEGDGILDFEAKVFPEGETEYRIPLGERHAPNFGLALAMVDGKELHQASRHFLVTRPLTVKVVPGSGRVLPGGKVSVEVECRDPGGKPVPAELSIAVVDEALLALSPDDSPSLEDVFFGAQVRRSLKMRTLSSCTFAYEGRTRSVNAALLAEDAARDRARREAEERKAWTSNDDFVLGRGRLAEKMDKLADMPAAAEEPEANASMDSFETVTGVGGGAGGRFGGRRGGGRPGMRGQSRQDQQVLLQDQLEGLQNFSLGYTHLANKPVRGFFYDDGADRDIRTRTEVLFAAQLDKLNAFGIGQQLVVEGRVAVQAETPKVPSQAFAVWLGAVTTGADGKGRAELVLPDKAGSWKLRARAVGNDAWFGEDEAELVTAKDLFVRVGLPAVLTEGDEAHGELSLHKQGSGGVEATYEVRHGDTSLASGKLRIDAGAEVRRPLVYVAKEAGDHSLTAKVEGGGEADTLEQPLRVMSWSLEEQAARSGTISGVERFALELPEGATYRDPALLVELGPEAPDAFLVAGWSRQSGLNSAKLLCYLPETHANRTALALAALALLDYRRDSAPDEKASLMLLRHRVESAIAELQNLENNGEIAWIGRGVIDARTSLLAWLLLERARTKGFVVDEQVIGRMRNRLSLYLRDGNHGLATLAFMVTAEAGMADFSRFNTLYRSRGNMDIGARARLVLAAHAMKRPELAVELLDPLATQIEGQLPLARLEAEHRSGGALHPFESLLWGLCALSRAGSHKELCDRAETWLYARRRASGWPNGMSTALAVDFLCSRSRAPARVATTVRIVVNDRFDKTYDFRKDPSYRAIVIPAEALEAGTNKLVVETSGQGSILYTATLSARTVGLPDKRIGDEEVSRHYRQDAPRLGDQILPEGFAQVERVKGWANEATAVRVGDSLRVTVRFRPTSSERASMGGIVLEEPLPAGCFVRREDLTGSFDHIELVPGFLRIYVSPDKGLSLDYVLRGAVAGSYKVLPTRVHSLDNPGISYYGKPAALRVLGPDEASPDERRPTPDELYARGVTLFDRLDEEGLRTREAERTAAKDPLQALWTGFRDKLRPAPFVEVARRLLQIALVEGEHRRTIELFEALKDRDSAYQLGFQDMAKVGQAYYQSGEFEQALNVYRAIAEAAFLREAQIAGTLSRIGQLQSSVRFLDNQFLSFPPQPTIRGAMYALAQKLNLKADELERSGARYDERVGTPLSLRAQARSLCNEFLLRFPDDADADEVVFTLASVAVEAEQYEEALELLSCGIEAHPDSSWLDEFLYLSGYAHFLRGEHDEALRVLARVATEDFPLGDGRKGPSDSRWLAIFLEGQIHHANQRPKAALAAYAKVEERFHEATEAAAYFTGKKLSVPEVSIAMPGSEGGVKLAWRNLESLELTVYKVDLMRLYLLRKSLSDMGEVQLSGIKPTHEAKVDLPEGIDYLDHERLFPLPLPETGAYLVIARSGELRGSGLFLRTDLAIEAQEIEAESRLRVNVKSEGRLLPKAEVKVVGAQDGHIRSGRTDLRGVYVADGLIGKATVLVKQGDRYAFYQSRSDFGAGPKPQQEAGKNLRYKDAKDFDALEFNRASNLKIQSGRKKQIEELLDNDVRGVEIRKAK